ncbi:MAG: DUF7009 family protein [Capsulimonadaceae bacterium]
MKVRWTLRSIRFRITPAELDALSANSDVSTEIALPGGAWRATVAVADDETAIAVSGGDVRVTLSRTDLARLVRSDAEGVYFTADTGARYFIEKDFPCVHPGAPEAGEVAHETFPPPPGFARRHGG